MGILPGVLLLTLLSVNLSEATEIPAAQLHNIVRQFGNANTQFAFLMVLGRDQCAAGMGNFNARVPLETAGANDNFISFYPTTANVDPGAFCSESWMLFSDVTNPLNINQQSPAQRFAETMNGRKTLDGGGCVIFYSTYTPCTGRCFQGGPCRWDIVTPLTANPFLNWGNRKDVHMYFVYRRPYVPEKFLHDINKPGGTAEQKYNTVQTLTRKGFQRLAEARFAIYRCENNVCRRCTDKDFCVEWPVLVTKSPVS